MYKSYWHWFFKGTGDKPGILRFCNIWSIIHLGIGLLLSITISIQISEAAKAVLLPLAGVLIGLAFAWGGNAMALLQTDEIEKLSDKHPGGFEEYVYVYQTAILIVLITLSLWGVAGLGLFDNFWPTTANFYFYFVVKALLYFFASISLRECWHVVLGAQQMLLARRQIKKALNKSSMAREEAKGKAGSGMEKEI